MRLCLHVVGNEVGGGVGVDLASWPVRIVGEVRGQQGDTQLTLNRGFRGKQPNSGTHTVIYIIHTTYLQFTYTQHTYIHTNTHTHKHTYIHTQEGRRHYHKDISLCQCTSSCKCVLQMCILHILTEVFSYTRSMVCSLYCACTLKVDKEVLGPSASG